MLLTIVVIGIFVAVIMEEIDFWVLECKVELVAWQKGSDLSSWAKNTKLMLFKSPSLLLLNVSMRISLAILTKTNVNMHYRQFTCHDIQLETDIEVEPSLQTVAQYHRPQKYHLEIQWCGAVVRLYANNVCWRKQFMINHRFSNAILLSLGMHVFLYIGVVHVQRLRGRTFA
jgi:hypothetical protein